MPGGPNGPGGQENLNALQRAIDSMEEKGMQEDPRYSQLLALRARHANMEPPVRPPPPQVLMSPFFSSEMHRCHFITFVNQV